MLNIKKLTQDVKCERFSLSIKPSDTAMLNYTKTVKNSIQKMIDELRDSESPDRGFSINLVNTKRLNSGWHNLIVDTVKYVIKKNIVGLDIWIAKKQSNDIKKLEKELNNLLKNQKTSVRIRKDLRKKDFNFWQFASFIAGLVMIVGGAFLPESKIETEWVKGIGVTQFIGALLIISTIIPKFLEVYKNFKKDKK